MDLLSLAEDIIGRSLKQGSDAAEVFIKSAKGLSVEVKSGRVEALEASRDFGIALRVIKNQRLGFSFTTTPDDIDKIIDNAIQGTGWTDVDACIDIPEYAPGMNVQVFDKKIEGTGEEEVIEHAKMLEEKAIAYDRRIKKVRKAEASAGTVKTVILNSKGVNIAYNSSYISAYVMSLAQDERGDSQIGWSYAISRRKEDIDFGSIGTEASRRAISLLGSRKITPVRVPVVLDPPVAVEFLGILSASISAEAVQKKKSFLAGKLGKAVISSLVDIVDDGIMPWGIGTKPVDDEGVPPSKKTVVSKGRLMSFIHNIYTAKKAGVSSTGNASRGGIKGLPGISVTNFYIPPQTTEKGKNDLVGSVSKGVLVTDAMGVHTADPVSGDFSIGISGLWIENGEIAYPLKEAIISGNILELFKRVEDVGNDLKFYGSIGSPSLLIGEMDISA